MFKTLWQNFSRSQKIIFLGVSQLVLIGLMVLLVIFLNQEKTHIVIQDDTELKAVPAAEMDSFKVILWNLISANVKDVDRSVIDDVKVRPGSYKVSTEEDITYTDFIIDIDSIKQTYTVAIQWSSKEQLPDGVIINCPTKAKMKYPETYCKGMYNDSYSFELYIPYYEHGKNEGAAPIFSIEEEEETNSIVSYISVCDFDKYKKQAEAYLKSIPIDLSAYNFRTEVNGVDVECD